MPHSSLQNLSPIDVFMSQVSKVKFIKDTAKLKEKFLLRIKRTVTHDATFTINNILFETNQRFASSRVEIRYDPEWLENTNTAVLIYSNDKKVGDAHIVDFHENAHMKRKGRPIGVKIETKSQEYIVQADEKQEQTISFTDLMKGGI